MQSGLWQHHKDTDGKSTISQTDPPNQLKTNSHNRQVLCWVKRTEGHIVQMGIT